MASHYYIVSTLPMLLPGGECPFFPEEFIARLRGFVSDYELKQLEHLSLLPPEDVPLGVHPAIAAWYDWETALRNAMVHIRLKASDAGGDSRGHLRSGGGSYSEIGHALSEAFGKHNPLETEKILDSLRWCRLEELECGHYFDFVKLCVYKLKLLICHKHGLRDNERGAKFFDQITDSIYGAVADGAT